MRVYLSQKIRYFYTNAYIYIYIYIYIYHTGTNSNENDEFEQHIKKDILNHFDIVRWNILIITHFYDIGFV